MDFLDNYFEEYKNKIYNKEIKDKIFEFARIAKIVKENKKKIIFGGNGASSSIASHGSVDFTKQGGVRSINFNEANLITCFANDYGFENYLAQAIKAYANSGDVICLISVSGTSSNVVQAAKYAKDQGLTVVSFTGRYEDNPLKALSDLAFWVDSHAYNIVECLHMIWLTATIDLVIGKAEYETSFK